MLYPTNSVRASKYTSVLLFSLLILIALAGCTQQPAAPQLTHISIPLTTDQNCSDTFQPHTLNHVTTASGQIVSLYESNGSGVAINDLDNDGDLDIVLGNLHGDNTILWNEGDLNFRGHRLNHGNTRAVNIVDVDGDGLLDIVFTRRFDKPAFWRNQGNEQFTQGILPAVNNPLFTMDWGDMDNDGDLDLIAASYDTEIRKKEGGIFDYRGGGIGVFVYALETTDKEKEGDNFGTYHAQRLVDQADSLALSVVDINGDQRLDIIVGNDFVRPDYAWQRIGPDALDLEQPDTNWQATQPFAATTENTMSYSVGDINNDGVDELFAADMKPYATDKATLAAWEPLLQMMHHATEPDDPQIVENVLLVSGTDGRYQNIGPERAIDATGWSWSSKFGDLDQDGFLDLYVVNGMIATDFLPHLPNNALVEENQALRNDGRGHFTPAPEWNLGSTSSGRGMSMGDLDNDGDLDIVVNNLSSPAQLFENQLCLGSSIQIQLAWPSSKNSVALGSRLTLHTSSGSYHRTVHASSGYLSGDPARVHFGLPDGTIVERLEIRWPDRVESSVTSLSKDSLVVVTRQ